MIKDTFERANIQYAAIVEIEEAQTIYIARCMQKMNTPPDVVMSWVLAKATRPERAN